MSQTIQTQTSLRSFRIAPSSFDEMKTERGGKIVLLAFLATAIVLGCLLGIKTGGVWGWLPVLAAWVAIICFPHLSILLHELGHVATAWALGMRTFGVQVGTGKIAFRKEWRGIVWEMRWVPFLGLASCGHTTRKWLRTKHMLMIAAGPAVTFAQFLCGVYFFDLGTGSSGDGFLPGREAFSMLGFIVVVWPAVTLLENLWPRKSLPYAVSVGSDGWQLMRTPFLKEAEIEETLVSTYVQEARFAAAGGTVEGALKCLELGLERYPSHWLLHMNCAACYLAQYKHSEAIAHFSKALESLSLPLSMRTRVLDQLACIPLYSRETEFLKDADEWSLRALEIEPSSLTLKATRGAILVDLGRLQQGRALLEETFTGSTSDNDKYVCACFLALAASKEGEATKAAKLVETARNLGVKSVLLGRIVTQITAAADESSSQAYHIAQSSCSQ